MLLPPSLPPSLEGDSDTLGTGDDYSLPESLHILSALVRVTEKIFKEPEKRLHFIHKWLSSFYFLYWFAFFFCKYFIIMFFSCSEVDQSSFFQGSQEGNLLRILYTGILHPIPFMVILMFFCWLGKLNFCLVKDNKCSVYQNTAFSVICVKLAGRWRGGRFVGSPWKMIEAFRTSEKKRIITL